MMGLGLMSTELCFIDLVMKLLAKLITIPCRCLLRLFFGVQGGFFRSSPP